VLPGLVAAGVQQHLLLLASACASCAEPPLGHPRHQQPTACKVIKVTWVALVSEGSGGALQHRKLPCWTSCKGADTGML
jgi:hypothetical protein